MKKHSFMFPLVVLALLAMTTPQSALAHSHTSFEIKGKIYSFTVGSLGEPVAVDDKTGLDLRVASMSRHAHEESEMSGTEHAGTPVVGLEKTLKVELIAGEVKKTLDITPAYNDPGAYRAYFIPTVQTTFSYRLFGTIDTVSFDYTFTCNPAGHPQSAEDKTEVEVSPGIKRTEAAGAFGCPVARENLGFPEPSVTAYELDAKASEAKDAANSSRAFGVTGIVIGLLGLVAGSTALLRKK